MALVSYEARRSDRTELFPFGIGATGMIIWTSDGSFAAQIRPGEAHDGGQPNYIAYYGTWNFDEASAELLHDVEGALGATMLGTVQRRHVSFDGDHVTLAPPPREVEGTTVTMSLTWERERHAGTSS